MVLLENFHRDTVTEIMGLEFGEADPLAVNLAEAPDVLARHRLACLAHRTTTPSGPEERRLRPDTVDLLRENQFHVRLQERHDDGREWDVARLAALDEDIPKTPLPIEVLNTERRNGSAPHAGVTQDQKDRHVTWSAACLRGPDQRVHDLRARYLLRRLATVRRPLELGDRVGHQHSRFT